MILADLEEHIAARLATIKLAGEAVKVYPYIPYRENGETTFPCAGFQRNGRRPLPIRRSWESVFTASEEEVTIDVQQNLGGGVATGPEMYTRKPYPSPWEFIYEIQFVSVDKDQADLLLQAFETAFPRDHSVVLGWQRPVFIHGDPIDLSDLTLPEFRTGYIFHVSPVWIESLKSWETAPIQTINFDAEYDEGGQ